jgi:hypothetical protein
VKRKSAQLAHALRHKLLVEFSRPFERNRVLGYVLDIGPRFFLVEGVYDCVILNGFECYRVSDVRNLKVPHKHAAFIEAALKKLGQRRQRKPPVKLGSLKELLESANRAFPLVAIHRERLRPDVCHIGRVIGTNKDCVSLLEIEPGAKWERKPTEYQLSEITQVGFGGSYEEALHLVGGAPPVVSI